MSAMAIEDQTCFASGRYSKRKRTQVNYHMDELDVSDSESDFEHVQVKKRKAVVSRPLPKNKVFPFMELPAEIRNMIYSYTLTDPDGINLMGTFKHQRRTVERISAELLTQMTGTYRRPTRRYGQGAQDAGTEPVSLVPSLLAVCKQIYSEGRDFLYGNELVFADSFALYCFMLNISSAGAKQLQHLRLLEWAHGRGMKGYNHSCFAVLVQATNLKTFRLDSSSSWARSPKLAAAKLYRDAFPWLEAIGAAKGKANAGVDVLRLDPEEFNYHWDHEYMNKEGCNQFLDALSQLLETQQKRVMGMPAKKRKKATKDIDANEL